MGDELSGCGEDLIDGPPDGEAPGASAAEPDGPEGMPADPIDGLLAAVSDAGSTAAAIRAIRAGLGARHACYVAARVGHAPHKDPYVRTTYPPLWIARYLMMEYWRIDPVLQQGFRRAVPFDWTGLRDADEACARFFADAAAHGVGRNGVCVPLTNAHARRGLVAVTTDREGTAFQRWRKAVTKPLVALGAVVHARALHEIHGDAPPPPRLSPREREVLAWVGEGKEVPDIAIITGLSEHTVRSYLKSARLKLDCGTKTQAAVKAERLALLDQDWA